MSNRETINLISKGSGLGNLSATATNVHKGINHRGVGNPVTQNTDNHGLTFFTRPRLNLSYDNLSASRILAPLLTQSELTQQRLIRVLLDPDGTKSPRSVKAPGLVDERSAFIPMLTNNLLSISGWPDVDVDTYTSQEGIAKESWSMIDDIPRNYGTYSLTANFRNIIGDPISALFYAWTHYAMAVGRGELVPYPEMIVENEIDYMTRIYRLVLDPTRTYVQKIANCGAAFPTAVPMGAAFNYSADSPLANDNEQISIPFQCIGVEYNDPISIQEFNATVAYFNPEMGDATREQLFTKLTKSELSLFNYQGYPRIAEDNELEWWVAKDTYQLTIDEQVAIAGV
tara:strand:- start:5806 stop:6834 length:1029 start_codon:yes stop_codon:yes gene_type:complete